MFRSKKNMEKTLWVVDIWTSGVFSLHEFMSTISSRNLNGMPLALSIIQFLPKNGIKPCHCTLENSPGTWSASLEKEKHQPKLLFPSWFSGAYWKYASSFFLSRSAFHPIQYKKSECSVPLRVWLPKTWKRMEEMQRIAKVSIKPLDNWCMRGSIY